MIQKNPQILVVDDDPDLRELLGRYLSAQGFEVTAVEDGAAMDTFLATHSTDLIILDLMLPGEDGLSIAKRLRSDGDTPIIMLSARGEEVDRIVGLEVGADDYLSKPFNPRELLARIRAVLRRPTATSQSKSATSQEQAFRFGPFRLGPVTRDATVIQVLDRGEGIPASEHEAVFRLFHRLETSRSRKTGGRGLGLAIARQLFDARGWKIELLPCEGGGTEARLEIPLAAITP